MGKVHCCVDGGVARIRLDNPRKLNALDFAMLDDLERIVGDLETRRDVRAVVVEATPARAFCAGADIEDWSALDAEDFAQLWIARGNRLFDRIAVLPAPTLAALDGPAMGGGFELVCCCDIRIGSARATVSLPETSIGVIPGWGGLTRGLAHFPPSVIAAMALFGESLSAEAALSHGFLSALCETPLETALDWAERARRRAPGATRTAKRLIAAAQIHPHAAAVNALAGACSAATPEAQEGVAAFREKRQGAYEASRQK